MDVGGVNDRETRLEAAMREAVPDLEEKLLGVLRQLQASIEEHVPRDSDDGGPGLSGAAGHAARHIRAVLAEAERKISAENLKRYIDRAKTLPPTDTKIADRLIAAKRAGFSRGCVLCGAGIREDEPHDCPEARR